MTWLDHAYPSTLDYIIELPIYNVGGVKFNFELSNVSFTTYYVFVYVGRRRRL